MKYLVVLGLCIAGIAVVFIYVAKRALSPRDIYLDPHSPWFGPLMRCRHCNSVVSRRNMHEHGVNCPNRPAQPTKNRRA
jgi:hypothetical protein